MTKLPKKTEISEPTNGGKTPIEYALPYTMNVSIQGTADILFHRWNCESIAEKANARKGSKAKKTDDLESYVYRCDNGNLGLPGEYFRQSIIGAAKYRQDPRSPRKSAQDLYKAGVISMTIIADLREPHWQFEHKCRVQIQRQGVTRTRPALKVGWRASFDLLVQTPEYISSDDLVEVITNAGRLVGVADHRPTYGRYIICNWKIA